MSIKVTFVLPGRGRSGGVRVTVEMANRLLLLGYKVRIAVKSIKRLNDNLEKIMLSLSGYKNVDWMKDFKGKAENFTDLNKLTFDKEEIVIAVGMYTINDVNNLRYDVIKVRYNHGFSVVNQELAKSVWSLPMNTITVSKTLIPKLEKLSNEKVLAVIPNGLNTEQYYVEGIKRNGIGIMYSPHPNKAPEDIIKLMRQVHNKLPESPKYIFGIEAKPKQLAFSNYFRYPSISKAREIYNRSIIWISTSREEGLPGPILEAMACGCVILSANNLGAKEIINNGENGFIVPVGDIDAFMYHIDLLLNDELLRQKIVQAGFETIKKFSWENAVEKMDTFIKQISKNNRKQCVQ